MAITGAPYISVPGASRSEQHDTTAFKVGIYQYETVTLSGSTTGAFAYSSHQIGAKLILGERIFYWTRAQLTNATLPGQLLQAAVPSTASNGANSVVLYANASAGTTNIQVTLSAAQTTSGFYNGGYLNIVNPQGSNANLVTTHRIMTTSANSTVANTANVINVQLYDPLPFGVTTAANISLTQSMWDRPIIANATTLTAVPVGVPLIGVPASVANTTDYYFWTQTWGPCGVACNAAPTAIGQTQTIGVVAGFLGAGNANAILPPLAITIRPQAANAYSLVYLTIAP